LNEIQVRNSGSSSGEKQILNPQLAEQTIHLENVSENLLFFHFFQKKEAEGTERFFQLNQK